MNNIYTLRKQAKLTQAELAKILNVHQTAVSQWEKDRTKPDIDQMITLADYFHVSVECIAGKSPIQSSKKKIGKRIPVYGKVAAGIPIDAITDIEDYEEIDEDMAAQGEYIALRIRGDSMEPNIINNDIIIIRLTDDIDSGKIGVFMVNGDEATCKRIKKMPSGIMLCSTNPKYDPMYFSNKEVSTLPVRVLGEVAEIRRKVN